MQLGLDGNKVGDHPCLRSRLLWRREILLSSQLHSKQIAVSEVKRFSLLAFCVLLYMMQSIDASAQFPPGTNVDESKVPPYVLPDPLVMSNGKKVKDTNEWNTIQRPYIYHLFEENVYGRYPTQPVAIRFKIRESSNNA